LPAASFFLAWLRLTAFNWKVAIGHSLLILVKHLQEKKKTITKISKQANKQKKKTFSADGDQYLFSG